VLDVADTVRLVMAPARAELARRIDARFEGMMAAGALEEAKALAELKLDPGLPIMGALGLGPLLQHLAGTVSLEAAIAAAQAETRQYAKRQLTWLRGNMMSWNWISEKEMESNGWTSIAFIDP
jgi:tRNA dimethylallyltransferase